MADISTSQRDKLRVTLPIVIGIMVGVIGLWLLTPLIMMALVAGDLAAKGQAGDQYGSVNALFSGLAFAGVIIAILLQREELALQRQELRETRAEMKRTADAQDLAQKALNQTIWAQSFKVAVDTMETPVLVDARGFLVRERSVFQRKRKEWPQRHIDSAEIVTRSLREACCRSSM